MPSKNNAGKAPTTPLWRMAFDTVERPIASLSESWVQSDAFMDLLTVLWRAQRGALTSVQRRSNAWMEMWDIPTRADLQRLRTQVAGLEREIRELRLATEDGTGPAGGRESR